MNKREELLVHMVKGLHTAQSTINDPHWSFSFLNYVANTARCIFCLPYRKKSQMEVKNIEIWNTDADVLHTTEQVAREMGCDTNYDEELGSLKIQYIPEKSYIVAALNGKHPSWMNKYFEAEECNSQSEDVVTKNVVTKNVVEETPN